MGSAGKAVLNVAGKAGMLAGGVLLFGGAMLAEGLYRAAKGAHVKRRGKSREGRIPKGSSMRKKGKGKAIDWNAGKDLDDDGTGVAGGGSGGGGGGAVWEEEDNDDEGGGDGEEEGGGGGGDGDVPGTPPEQVRRFFCAVTSTKR